MSNKENEYQTIRIWVKTQKRLKLLAVYLDKSMIETLDDLVEEKLQPIERERGDKRHADEKL